MSDDDQKGTPGEVSPQTAAALTRRKIPFWAALVLLLLPLWAVVYALTLDPPTPSEPGPLELGADIYAVSCSSCHGAGGAGVGANPSLDQVTEHFAQPADMVTWVALASSGYRAAGIDEYAPGVAVGGGASMPAFGDALTAEELMAVVLHERSEFGGEAFDPAIWEEGWEESLSELLPPEKVDEYTAVLEEWKADPPA